MISFFIDIELVRVGNYSEKQLSTLNLFAAGHDLLIVGTDSQAVVRDLFMAVRDFQEVRRDFYIVGNDF
jgi:hypothetical protein